MDALLFSFLAVTAAALPTADSAHPPAIPISYSYGGYPRIQADIKWGTPAEKYIPTIFDTGSSGFWVYGPNSTINDGSPYHYTLGPCNISVKNFYNWPTSKSRSKVELLSSPYQFAYGGNGKIITAPSQVNDTFSFTSGKWPALTNNQVALANFTEVTETDDGCQNTEADFDHSILGLAPVITGLSSGPSFRANMLAQGKTKSSSFSMWFDKPSNDVKATLQGTAIFGAVPCKSKYSGELVRLKENPPSVYLGYYVSTPVLTATNLKKPGKAQKIKTSDKTVKQCLLDSGTGEDRVPFSQDQLLKVTGLIQYDKDAYFTAWNGPCSSIPTTATLNYTFTGETRGKNVTVAVPIRNYARGEYDDIPGVDTNKICGLSISPDETGDCVLGAPFMAAAFAVFNDDKKQVALAQGGVSTGAADGPSGLGPVTPILAGQDVPGSV